jgi:hypothetical protein
MLGSYLKREHTHYKVIIMVQERVAMSLPRLGSDDGLLLINVAISAFLCKIQAPTVERRLLNTFPCQKLNIVVIGGEELH